jgi:hypothetical protein
MQPQSNGKPFSFQELFLGTIALTLFSFASYINQKNMRPRIDVLKQDSAITINRNLLKFFNIGNKRMIADLIWIQTLLEGDEDHYSKLDLNSWMYHRFMSIADMDPLFYENYLHGGMYLSIVKDDPLGATEIFQRGLIYYPNDYRLNYNLGYNLVFELMNLKEGLAYFEKIKKDPKTPAFFDSLINKLRFEVTGDFNLALIFLRDRLNQTQDPYIKKKIQDEIYSLKAEMDLDCLNRKKNNCNKFDEDGIPYRKNENNKWVALKKFKRYQLNLTRRK